VWEYLQREIGKGGTLRQTAEDMAKAVKAHCGIEFGDQCVGSVLGIMESNRLIRREYYVNAPDRKEIRVDPAILKETSGSGFPAREQRVLEWVKEAKMLPDEAVVVSLSKLSAECGASKALCTAALRNVGKKTGAWSIKRPFTGKTTTLMPKVRGAALDNLLDEEALERKRDIAIRRLKGMIDYLTCPDKVAYIRTYFGVTE
jgi:hypothetical protein